MLYRDIIYELFRAILDFETAWALAQCCKQNYAIFRDILPEKVRIYKSGHEIYLGGYYKQLYLFDKLIFEVNERHVFNIENGNVIYLLDFKIYNFNDFICQFKSKVNISTLVSDLLCVIENNKINYDKKLSTLDNPKLCEKIVNYIELIYNIIARNNYSINVLKSFKLALDIAKVNWPGQARPSNPKTIDFVPFFV